MEWDSERVFWGNIVKCFLERSYSLWISKFCVVVCRKHRMWDVCMYLDLLILLLILFTFSSWANNGYTAYNFSVWVNIFSSVWREGNKPYKWSFVCNFPESAQSAPGLGVALEGRDQIVAHTAQAHSQPVWVNAWVLVSLFFQ